MLAEVFVVEGGGRGRTRETRLSLGCSGNGDDAPEREKGGERGGEEIEDAIVAVAGRSFPRRWYS